MQAELSKVENTVAQVSDHNWTPELRPWLRPAGDQGMERKGFQLLEGQASGAPEA